MENPNWDDVPDIAPDGRSFVPFPDPDPEFTAGVWARHHADRAARRGIVEVDPDEDPDANSAYKDYHPAKVTQEAEEFDEPCKPLAAWVKKAHANGWEIVELAHALSVSEGKPFGSGEKAGQPRPTRHVDLQWLKIEKAGVGRGLIVYPVVNGEVLGTRVSRRFNGSVMSDKEMNEKVKNG